MAADEWAMKADEIFIEIGASRRRWLAAYYRWPMRNK